MQIKPLQPSLIMRSMVSCILSRASAGIRYSLLRRPSLTSSCRDLPTYPWQTYQLFCFRNQHYMQSWRFVKQKHLDCICLWFHKVSSCVFQELRTGTSWVSSWLSNSLKFLKKNFMFFSYNFSTCKLCNSVSVCWVAKSVRRTFIRSAGVFKITCCL